MRVAALDPTTYGHIGDIAGKRGPEELADVLGSLDGVDVLTGVKVKRARQDAGDLDVVALDPATGRGLIIEVKAPIAPDSMDEIGNIETTLTGAQTILSRLRADLISGKSTCRWPPNWPQFTSVDWTFGILSLHHMPCTPELLNATFPIRTLRAIKSSGPTTLDDVIKVFVEPPPASRESRRFVVNWNQVSVGPYEVSVEGLASAAGSLTSK